MNFLYYKLNDQVIPSTNIGSQLWGFDVDPEDIQEELKIEKIIEHPHKIVIAKAAVEPHLNQSEFLQRYFMNENFNNVYNPYFLDKNNKFEGTAFVQSDDGTYMSVFQVLRKGLTIAGNYNGHSYRTGEMLVIASSTVLDKSSMFSTLDDFFDEKNFERKSFSSNEKDLMDKTFKYLIDNIETGSPLINSYFIINGIDRSNLKHCCSYKDNL